MTLRWETRNGSELFIKDNRGNDIFTTEDDDLVEEGDVIVRPTRDTRYTLTVERKSSRDLCNVEVETDGEVTFLSDRQPLTSISLSSVPYTGFDAGPFLTSLFYLMIGLWSAALAYVYVLKKRGMTLGMIYGATVAAVAGAAGSLPRREYQAAQVMASASAVAPANLPTGAYAQVEEEADDTAATMSAGAHLEDRAHAHNVLLSSDAIRLILDQAESPADELALLDAIITRAKVAYPREDGWVVINRARIAELFAHDDVPEVAEPVLEVAPVSSTTLAHAIVRGDIVGAYAAVGGAPLAALAQAAADLDTLFRARRGEDARGQGTLVQAAANLGDAQLEAAIAALAGAIDGTYHDEAAAVKLAVLKAVNAIA